MRWSLLDYWRLTWILAKSTILNKYAHVSFGLIWILLQPALQTMVVGLIFQQFITVPNYYLFLFSGLLPWQFLSSSINRSLFVFIQHKNILEKTFFPREILVFGNTLADFILFLGGMLVAIIWGIMTYGLKSSLLWIVFGVLWLALFCAGTSLGLAVLHTKNRTIQFIVQTVLVVWFYATPIVYSREILPDSLKFVLWFNPVFAPIELIRNGIIGAQPIEWMIVLTNLVVSCVLVAISFIWYKKTSASIVDWI